MPVERALVSVSHKAGVATFAQSLAEMGIEVYSTGGTARTLREHGVAVVEIADYTAFPEMMDGRVKTLHPRVAGGILARRDNPADVKALAEHGMVTFDLVVVNLYPFEETIGRENVSYDEAVEQIDIGGPTLIRAAAKNHRFVTVVTHPSQYDRVLSELRLGGDTTAALRRELMVEAFRHTAHYDRVIADYFARDRAEDGFPERLYLELDRRATLRYGENPHQQAALYAAVGSSGSGLAGCEQLHGKELSYNNLLDLDSALALVREFREPAAVVLKHNNPCGAACHASLSQAFLRAYEGDPVSAFGSVIGLNRPVDAETADALCEPGRFIEAIVAPNFSPEALAALTTRPTWKNNVRLLKSPAGATAGLSGSVSAHGWTSQPWHPSQSGAPLDYRGVAGGMLVQTRDTLPDAPEEWRVVSRREPAEGERADLEFAWKVARHVRSNAIVFAKDRQVVGVGAGQMSRVDSVRIATHKADGRAKGAVCASDAFFPFRDGLDQAAEAGITAAIEPGGSKRDDEVIQAANQHNLALLFTGRRHFRH